MAKPTDSEKVNPPSKQTKLILLVGIIFIQKLAVIYGLCGPRRRFSRRFDSQEDRPFAPLNEDKHGRFCI